MLTPKKAVLYFGVTLFMLSFVFGCGYHSPRYVKLADRITEQTARKLQKQKNLCLVGTGGQMMDDIQVMDMSFFYYQEVDLKTGRELIVNAINEYLLAINSNKEVRPYLHEYPFTAKNVEIRIFLYKPDRSNLPPSIAEIYSIFSGGRLDRSGL